jgi:predicted RNase H-like HicB family nuclease
VWCLAIAHHLATGQTPEETEANMREAIRFHIEGLIEDRLPVPPAGSRLAYAGA